MQYPILFINSFIPLLNKYSLDAHCSKPYETFEH